MAVADPEHVTTAEWNKVQQNIYLQFGWEINWKLGVVHANLSMDETYPIILPYLKDIAAYYYDTDDLLCFLHY